MAAGAHRTEEAAMRIFTVVFSVVCVLAFALGSVGSRAMAEESNLPGVGTRQVMFGFSSWALGSYRGGAGLRTYVRDDIALRIGLVFGWSDGQRDTENEDRRMRTGDRSNISLGIGALVERHFPAAWDVVPFVGTGVAFEYGSSMREERWTDEDELRTWTYDLTGYSVRADLLGGIQWHFTEVLSLGGEYVFSFTYAWEDGEETDTQGGTSEVGRFTDRSMSMGLNASHLWLSIGF
jgi:hypothetical protein